MSNRNTERRRPSKHDDGHDARGPKSTVEDTPNDRRTDERAPRKPSSDATADDLVPVRRQGVTAWEPLRRPAEGASDTEWETFYLERRRRKTVKALRKGRIARREEPHDVESCEFCRAVPQRELDINVAEVAERSKMSRSHCYRVLDRNVADRRGIKTLLTMRRIAHDGLGIGLDEFAALVID
jgi:hypothetical protein